MKTKVFKYTALLALIIIAGCVRPYIRTIRVDGMPKLEKFKSTRPCSITIDPIKDRRPLYETKNTSQEKTSYFWTILLWWQWASAGPRFCDTINYDSSLTTNMQLLMKDVIGQSNLASGQGPEYVIKPELLHYYGVSYTKNFFCASVGAAASVNYTFFPTGFMMMNVDVVEKNSGKLVGSRLLSGTFLFNPDDTGTSLSHTAQAGWTGSGFSSSRVAAVSLRKIMERLPLTVDQILSGQVPVTDTTQVPKSFTIIRLTSEYEFEERIVIEYETGRIIKDAITKRQLPIISRPDEWIVSPLDPTGHWMTPEQYKKYIDVLKQKYSGIVFKDNLNAAVFASM
jgi:hypothetical protein